MSEKKYKKYIYQKANQVKSKEDLDKLLEEIINNKKLDYGTIVYAMSAAMLATAKYIDRSEVGGITGFQASFVGWEMVQNFITHSNTGMKLLNYDDLLYPQCEGRFDKIIDEGIWITIQKMAKDNLEKTPNAYPEVIKHWQSIVDGNIPFGFQLKQNKEKLN